jgi:hypothetical protein
MAASIFGSAATVVEMNLALFGTSPSNSVFNNQLTVVGSNNLNLVSYVNQITNANFTGTSDAALATTILANLLGNDPANSAGLNSALTQLLAANPANRGVVVYQVATILTQKEADGTYGNAAKAFNNEVTNGYNGSNNPATSVPFVPANTAQQVVGQTFVLTTGPDAFNGTVANDTFIGTETTLTSADNLTGGGGNDVLLFSTSGAATVNKAGFSTNGIQTVHVTSDAGAVGFGLGTNFDVSGMLGVQNLFNDNSSTDVQFIGTPNAISLTELNVSGGNTTVNYTAAALAANGSTPMNVTLNNNVTFAGGAIGNLTANGIGAFNVTTTGGASNIASIQSANLTSLTIGGTANLTLGGEVFSSPTANTLNASSLTGNLVVNGLNDSAAVPITVTGGSGNDTVTFTNFGAGTSYDGKGGTNTIALTDAVATGALGGTLANVQTLKITDGAVGSVNMSNFSGVLNVIDNGGLVGAQVIQNATTGLTVTDNVGSGAAGQNLTVGLKTDGTADAITLNLNKVGAASTVGTVNLSTFETVNLNVAADPSVLGATGLTVAQFTDANATTLNINSNTALTLTGTTTGALTLVDGSKSTGNLTINSLGYSTAGAVIKGGSGKDTITTGNGPDTVTLGAGADTLIYTAVAQSNDKMDVVTDFTSGTDVLDLTALGLISSTQFLGSRANFGLAQGALAGGGGVITAVLDSSTGILWVDTNPDGTLDNRDFRIQLNGVTSLTAADLNLVTSGNTVTLTAPGAVVSNTSTVGATGKTSVQGDTINTTAANFVGSTVDGGTGSDTLNITSDPAGAINLQAQTTSVETVNFQAGDTVGTVTGANIVQAITNGSAVNGMNVLLGTSTGASFSATGAGVDNVTLGAAAQSVTTGSGADTISTSQANALGSTFNGGAGNDTLAVTSTGAYTLGATAVAGTSSAWSGIENITMDASAHTFALSALSAGVTLTANGDFTLGVSNATAGQTATIADGGQTSTVLTLSGAGNFAVTGYLSTGVMADSASGSTSVTEAAGTTTSYSNTGTGTLTVNAAAHTANSITTAGTGPITITGYGTGNVASPLNSNGTGALTVTYAGTTGAETITQTAANTLSVNASTATTGVLTVATIAGDVDTVTFGTALANGGVVHTGAGTMNIVLGNQAGASTNTGSATGIDNITLGTSGGGNDTIVFTAGNVSNIGAIDTITNFNASGTDVIKTGTASTALNLLTIATADPSTLAAAISTAATAAGNTLSAAGQAYLITVNAGASAGTYLFENNGATVGAVDSTDMLVKLMGTTGALTIANVIA